MNPLTDIKATKETNFCRVFELPTSYPTGFCFNGGHPVAMIMVDWFNPWPPAKDQPFELANTTWPEVCKLLLTFLLQKRYVKAGKTYLLLTDFGGAFTFTKP